MARHPDRSKHNPDPGNNNEKKKRKRKKKDPDNGEVRDCVLDDTCLCTCANAVLSGGASADNPILVDDDLEVLVNGERRFIDDNNFCEGCPDAPGQNPPLPPIQPGRLTCGDVIRVVASNRFAFGGANSIQLNPLYLHCPAQGTAYVLDPDGFPRTLNDEQFFVFYNRVFTVGYSPSP